VSHLECLLTVTDVSRRPLNLKWHGLSFCCFPKKAEFIRNACDSSGYMQYHDWIESKIVEQIELEFQLQMWHIILTLTVTNALARNALQRHAFRCLRYPSRRSELLLLPVTNRASSDDVRTDSFNEKPIMTFEDRGCEETPLQVLECAGLIDVFRAWFEPIIWCPDATPMVS